MTTPTGDSPDPNPESDFEARCLETRRRWEAGELPFKEAVAQMMVLEKEAQAANDAAGQAVVERLLGFMQSHRGNFNTALRHYENAKAFFVQANNRRIAAAMDLNIGEVYRYKGDFNRARHYYRVAYEAAKETNFLTIQTLARGNEGHLLLRAERYDSALNAFEETLRLTEQWTEDLHMLSSVLSETHYGLALVYLAKDRPSDAWEQAKHALNHARQPLDLGFANRAIAETLTVLGKSPDEKFTDDPETYYQAAIDAFQEINAEAEMARTMYARAWSLARQGRKTTAARKFQQVMIIFTKLGMVDDAARAAEAQLSVL